MPCILRHKSCLKKGRNPTFGRRVRFKIGDSYLDFSPSGSNEGINLDTPCRRMNAFTPVCNDNILGTPGLPVYQTLPVTQCITSSPAFMYNSSPEPQQFTRTSTFQPFAEFQPAPTVFPTPHHHPFDSHLYEPPAPRVFPSFAPAPQSVATFAPITQASFSPFPWSVPQTIASFTPLTPSLLATSSPMLAGPFESRFHSPLSSIFQSIDWDMTSPPSAGKLNPCAASMLGTSCIDRYTPAMSPPDAHCKLIIKIANFEHMTMFWGDMVVKPNSWDSPMSIQDVLRAIYEYLHTPISEEHEGFIEARTPGILNKGFHRRMEKSSNPARYECRRGYLRIDSLGERTKFAGLRPVPATFRSQCPRGKGNYYLDIDVGCT